jgi:hypothetical protein
MAPAGMRVKLREELNPDELPVGRSDAPMPLRSPGKRPELSLQARGGGKLKLELGRASGGTAMLRFGANLTRMPSRAAAQDVR